MKSRTLFLVLCVACLTVWTATALDNMVFILDASNSMNKPLGALSRLDVAIDALSELLEGIPDGESVGLIAFGHRLSRLDEAESCRDIELMYAVEPLSSSRRDAMLSSILTINAQGMTPLAASLETAANTLADRAEAGTIILITDGEGNCGGLYEVMAETLAVMDPPIKLHIIGLDVEDAVRDALTQMASYSGGEYWSARDASGLLAALRAALDVSGDDATEPTGIPTWAARMGITNVIYGTEGDDVIYGTKGNDLILAVGGNNKIFAVGGNNILIGGPGNDLLVGGPGNDILFGGGGNNLLMGGPGGDILCGGTGNDTLEGEAGDDILFGGGGVNRLLGGPGQNMLYSINPHDILLEGMPVAGPSPECLELQALIQGTTTCPLPVSVCPPAAPPEAACVLGAAPSKDECALPAGVRTVREGQSLQLSGSVLDIDCNVVSVHWQVSAGHLDNPASMTPTYTAPRLDGCTDLEVEVVFTAVDRCGASGSDSFILRVLNVNHPPTVDAGPDRTVDEGMALLLEPQISDPDGDPVQVKWTVLGPTGSITDPTARNATFVAPWIDTCEGLNVIVRVDVTDPCGATASDTLTVCVRNVNHPPVVDLGPDFSMDEGATIRMQPVIHDPDCDELQYRWTISRGRLSDPCVANPTFTAPMTSYCDGETVVMTLTITDPCGLTSTDSVRIHVKNVNRAPLVDLGPDLCVLECSSILLKPIVSDPDADPLKYTWTVTGGALDSYSSPAAVFTAPSIHDCDGETFVVTLTVADPCGLSASDSIQIYVENVNHPPVVRVDR
jgi:hypothetical protein